MDSAEDLRRRIRGVTELGSVVRTMKALAAANVRQSEEAVASLTLYTQTVELAMQAVARYLPEELDPRVLAPRGDAQAGARLGAIVVGTDQGMCGPYNDQLAAFVARDLAGRGSGSGPRVWAVGERLAPSLGDAGLGEAIDGVFTTPGSIDGFGVKVSELLAGLEDWRLGRGLDQVLLYYHRPSGHASHSPVPVPFWPVDLSWLLELRGRRWESRTLPLVRLPWQEMLGHIARQYLFIQLYRALADALASENSARLLTMERAEKNIDERLTELGAQFNYVRQQSITVELLDIVSGFEALADEKRPPA